MEKYGIILGRFQPFHKGHESLVAAVKAKGLIPVIIIGSSQESGTTKNPYSTNQRADMILSIYPDVRLGKVPDDVSWERWVQNLIAAIPVPLPQATLVVHNKEEDRMDFSYKGQDFKNTFYSDIYNTEGLHTTVVNTPGIKVRATMIRDDLEKHKDFLSESVYSIMKGINHEQS